MSLADFEEEIWKNGRFSINYGFWTKISVFDIGHSANTFLPGQRIFRTVYKTAFYFPRGEPQEKILWRNSKVLESLYDLGDQKAFGVLAKTLWQGRQNSFLSPCEQIEEKKFEIVFFIVFGVYGENLIFDKTVLAKPNVRCPKDQLDRLLFWKSYKVFLFRTLIKTISDPGEKNQKRWIKSLPTSSDMQWKAKTFVWMKFFAFSNLEMEHKNLGFLAKNYRLDCEKSNLRVPSYFRWKKTIKVKLFIFSGNWMKNRILGKIFFEVKFSQHSWRISLLFVQT